MSRTLPSSPDRPLVLVSHLAHLLQTLAHLLPERVPAGGKLGRRER